MTIEKMEEGEHIGLVGLPEGCPGRLEGGRLTVQQFNTWKQSLFQYLQNNEEYNLFLPNNLYSDWSSVANAGVDLCIPNIDPKDPHHNSFDQDQLLGLRNSQLQKLLTLIYELNNQCLYEEICYNSTSLTGILSLLSIYCTEERRPVRILDLSEISPDEDLHAFYVKFRSAVCTNLKRKGDVIEFLNGELLEDETLSPTFEEIIVLWCLEKIHPNLPSRVKQTFNQQLQGSITLRDIQEEIFKVIPVLLQDVSDQNYVPLKLHSEEDNDFKSEIKIQSREVSVITKVPNLDQNVSTVSNLSKTDIDMNDEEMLDDVEHNEEVVLKKVNYCPHCNKPYKLNKYLTAHILREHKTIIQCTKCSKKFQDKKTFEKHSKCHVKKEVKIKKLEDSNSEMVLLKNEEEIPVFNMGDVVTQDFQSVVVHRKSEDLKHNDEDSNSKENNLVANDVEDGEPKILALSRTEHPCDICGKIFYSKTSMKKHYDNHFKDPKICTICNQLFGSKKLLTIHMKTTHNIGDNTKTHPCEICGKLFANHSLLKSHLKIHSDGWNSLQCVVCHRNFPSEDKMAIHICKHYSCDKCDQKFFKNKTLQAHKREHDGVKMLKCDQCESMFDKKKRLTEHIRFCHLGIKKYVCHLCPKAFSMKSGLNNHMLVHADIRPFECEECGQTFRQRAALNTHMKMHNNQLPYQCEFCDQRFRTHGLVRTHKENKHMASYITEVKF